MDNINIPYFALLRYGTVIVRLKMEKFLGSFSESCHQAEVQLKGISRVVHRVSSCEHCTRTRIVSQRSDCDSALVEKCRPNRTRAAKSRYVNVCAAVCLLLLVGELTPQSSAAPHRTRAMASDQENVSWSNPCDYDNKSKMIPLNYEPRLAEKVANYATFLHMEAYQLKDDIELTEIQTAKLHSYPSFEKMLDVWNDTEWLRNHSWFRDEVLPKEKAIGGAIEDKTVLVKFMTSEKLEEVLPILTTAMKMLGRSLQAVADSLWDNDPKERALKPKLAVLSNNMRHVLCLTSDVLRARNLEMPPLYDSEVPTYTNHETATMDVFLIYRDTINFLQYIEDFFTVMKKEVTK